MLIPQRNSRGAVKHRPRSASVAEPTISPDSLLEGDGFEPSIPSCDRPSANSRGPITRAKIPALIRFGHVIQRRRLDVRNRRGLRREHAGATARNQGLAQPLHDSAMDLALEADRVHHRPDVNLPRGTGSSNPPPSSGESAANLTCRGPITSALVCLRGIARRSGRRGSSLFLFARLAARHAIPWIPRPNWFLGSCDLSFSFASAFWRKYSGSSGSTWVRSSNRCPSFRTWASISLRPRVNCPAPLIGGPGSSLVCAGWRCRVRLGRSTPPGFPHLGGPARRTAMCGN
jgi:hypothetical protein